MFFNKLPGNHRVRQTCRGQKQVSLLRDEQGRYNSVWLGTKSRQVYLEKKQVRDRLDRSQVGKQKKPPRPHKSCVTHKTICGADRKTSCRCGWLVGVVQVKQPEVEEHRWQSSGGENGGTLPLHLFNVYCSLFLIGVRGYGCWSLPVTGTEAEAHRVTGCTDNIYLHTHTILFLYTKLGEFEVLLQTNVLVSSWTWIHTASSCGVRISQNHRD